MGIRLNFTYESDDVHKLELAIFQKNNALIFDELVLAGRIV
jgi:hypothetical protein